MVGCWVTRLRRLGIPAKIRRYVKRRRCGGRPGERVRKRILHCLAISGEMKCTLDDNLMLEGGLKLEETAFPFRLEPPSLPPAPPAMTFFPSNFASSQIPSLLGPSTKDVRTF